MPLLSFFLWSGIISTCFNSKRKLTFVNAGTKIFSYKRSNQIFVQFNGLSGDIFLLARILDVEITDNLFNFITPSFSETKGWIKRFGLDFAYTRVIVERFNYKHNRIKIVTCHRKRIKFWYVQSGYYGREKLIKCFTELLVAGYGLTIINEVNFFTFWWIFG